MSRAELVGLVDAAPGELRSIQATIRHWTHPGRSQAAADRLNDRPGLRALRVSLHVGGADMRPSEHLSRVWVELPGRWRYVTEASGRQLPDILDVADGTHQWTGTSEELTERAPRAGALGPLGWMLSPGHLLGATTFVDLSDDEAGGRPAVRATAHQRAGIDDMAGHMALAMGHHPGLDNRYWFDATYGFVLRHEGSVDGKPSTVTELLDVRVDEPIEPEQFRPPEAARIRSEWDERLALLQLQGIDTTGIPEGDVAAAEAAVAAAHQPPDLAALQARYVPTGPPPADRAAAEAAITAAFGAIGDTGGTGRDLVNVQAGEGLAPLMERAARRLPRATRENTRWAVDAIRFLDPEQAVVWFTVEAAGEPTVVRRRAGRAVRVDGRWLIEHATVVDLLELAGVRVPPPGER